ncbi:hypothetical protein KDA00_03975 [Candidatus Saccharibacteria bacterium]|nr:hypothetical protein [Candidatus Saccharibacteria bacterium]
MSKYHSNYRSSIEEIFEREGDSLARAGFVYPDMDTIPEEAVDHFRHIENRLSIDEPIPSALDEAASLGIELETYLEG